MKHLLGYVIWNKVKMLDWLTDGIVESFSPDQVDLLFVLDNPTDGSTEKLLDICNSKLSKFKFEIKVFTEEKYKFPCQNWMMNYAVDNGYDTLIAPQDDQKITDEWLIDNINNVLREYGVNIGVIGLRDGFDFGYGNMFSSGWSESVLSAVDRLLNGEPIEVQLINDGPIVYPVSTIRNIGVNDVETFRRFYIEDDYAMRCHRAGLKNIVMGNNLIHTKVLSHGVNASKASNHYENNDGELDMNAFKLKWKI